MQGEANLATSHYAQPLKGPVTSYVATLGTKLSTHEPLDGILSHVQTIVHTMQ